MNHEYCVHCDHAFKLHQLNDYGWWCDFENCACSSYEEKVVAEEEEDNGLNYELN